MKEPRCLVCGAPLGEGTQFETDVRNSEVCSDKCYKIYMDIIKCPDCLGVGSFGGNPASVEPDECARCFGTGEIIGGDGE